MSITDALVTALRTEIMDGRWEPGDRIAEVDVARRYEVSRPTAKTAIRVLVQDGLLRHTAHRACVVPRLGPADVNDLFFVRTPLELAVIEQLVSGESTPDLVATTAAIDKLDGITDRDPASSFVASDLGFHRRADRRGRQRQDEPYIRGIVRRDTPMHGADAPVSRA